MKTALVIVDVQNDFCEGGSLPVPGGAEVAAAIGPYAAAGGYDHVVATLDHHVDPGPHFSDEPDYIRTWPAHCVAGTAGAEFHPALDTSAVEEIFSKGRFSAAYSGFEGTGADETGLAEWLRSRGVEAVDVVGIATDHCVRATALDAARNGFTVRVLLHLTAGVTHATTKTALAELRSAGIQLVGAPVVKAS